MAYINGRDAGFYYNGDNLNCDLKVTPTQGIADGHLITFDGLYFMTADNKEFITKEDTNG